MVFRFDDYRGIGTPGCEQCNCVGFAQKYDGHKHFVEVSNKEHNFKYEYHFEYQGVDTKIPIFCKEFEHGYFMQTPYQHKNGSGCWRCHAEQKESKACQKLRAILTSLNIKFTTEKIFIGMKYVKFLRIDFYDENLNIAFEFDGKQHFYRTSWGGREALELSKIRDHHKDKYCLENDIHMYRFCRIEDITLEKIIEIRNICKSGTKQVYASYPDYIKTMSELIDMSKFNIITIQPPSKRY